MLKVVLLLGPVNARDALLLSMLYLKPRITQAFLESCGLGISSIPWTADWKYKISDIIPDLQTCVLPGSSSAGPHLTSEVLANSRRS